MPSHVIILNLMLFAAADVSSNIEEIYIFGNGSLSSHGKEDHLRTERNVDACSDYSEWNDQYPFCRAREQSPVDIEYEALENHKTDPLVFSGWEKPYDCEITNTGCKLEISLTIGEEYLVVGDEGVNRSSYEYYENDYYDDALCPTPSITGGGKGVIAYCLDKIIIYWGRDSTSGACHHLFGNKAPGEMHLVTHRNTFRDYSESLTRRGGVSIFAIWLRESFQSSPWFGTLRAALDSGDIRNPGGQYQTLVIPEKFLPMDTSEYFHYSGSMVEPPCNQGIYWTVFMHTMPITQEEFEALRTLKITDGRNMGDTCRPVQKIQSLTIFYTKSN